MIRDKEIQEVLDGKRQWCVVQGDCLEILPTLPENSIDLVLTDPPYGINADKNARAGKRHGNAISPSRDYGRKDWDSSTPDPDAFYQINRVGKNAIIWGGNYFTEWLCNSSCWLVWDKETGENGYADCELAWTNMTSAVRIFKWMWKGMFQEEMHYLLSFLRVRTVQQLLYI